MKKKFALKTFLTIIPALLLVVSGTNVSAGKKNVPVSDPVTETIVIDGCDSGVADQLLNDGAMSELIDSCGDGAVNHGAFVSCVAHRTNTWKKEGSITGKDKGAIQRCAASADIPKKCISDIDCDDGDVCNGAETCDKVCQPGTPVDCDDSDACTTDTCNAETGDCVYDPINCDDSNSETTDACDPATGLCVYTPVSCTDPCSDNNACTENDACEGDVCTGTPVNCDDDDLCTTDNCNAETGDCVYDPINCDDSNSETTDACDPATGLCVYTICGDGTCDSTETFTTCPADCVEGTGDTNGEESPLPTIGMNQKLFMMGTLLLLLLSI
jgi:hypothetical protein